MKLFCVRYKNPGPAFAFFRGYNAVRDSETYSLTYLVPSVLDGIVLENNLTGNIVRHKLRFDRMTKNGFSSCNLFKNSGIHVKHELKNPEIILGFDNKEDADKMFGRNIYGGQSQYIIPPCERFDADDTDFDDMPGVEAFAADKDDINSFYCGNNQQKNNERMYIKLTRIEWEK